MACVLAKMDPAAFPSLDDITQALGKQVSERVQVSLTGVYYGAFQRNSHSLRHGEELHPCLSFLPWSHIMFKGLWCPIQG